jgi:carboxypeptidase T
MVRRYPVFAGSICVLLISTLAAWGDEAVSYAGHKLVQVQAPTHADLDAIEAAGGIIMNCIPGPGTVDVVANDEQIARIRTAGMRATVVNNDVQALIDAERQQPVGRADAFTDFYLAYHRYGDAATSGTLVWYLNELVTRYPGLASMVNLGNSLQGRPIWAIRIANDAVAGPKPGVCYFSCQHAREWITTMVIPHHARHLLENYASDSTIRDMVDHVEIFLIPVANPDGYEYTWATNRLWRKNRKQVSIGVYGVDLNRNWGFNWGYDNNGSSPTPSSETYRGASAFSEPETQRLRDFFIAHPNIRATLDIHSYSQLILWPWGHLTSLAPDHADYEDIGFAMQALIQSVHGKVYTAGPIRTTIYATNGDSADWAYGERGVLSFSYELRPVSSNPGFQLPASEIVAQCQEILPAMLRLTNSAWVRSPVVIDLPNGAPGELLPGVDTTIEVTVQSKFETLAAGSPTLFYRYDVSGPFISQALAPQGGNTYEATLPATHCYSSPQYYFSAMSTAGSTVKNPYPGEAAPYIAGFSPRCGGFLPGDHNGDNAVNLTDYTSFAPCALGPGAGLAPDCFVFDFDDNDMVDLFDFAAMQRAMGP